MYKPIPLIKELFDKIAEVIIKKESLNKPITGTKTGLSAPENQKVKKGCEC